MDFKDLLNEVAAEVSAVQMGSMSQQDRIYHAVAQRLLMLERS